MGADMAPIVYVTDAAVAGDHRVWLRFEDGVEGEVDFSNQSWQGVFTPLADPAYFRQLSVDPELGTIVWPNGADVAPETLHGWVLDGPDRIPA
jgi:hypothetical protein